jgi:hypothetical protein
VPRQGSEYGHGCAAHVWGWSSESGIFGNSIACRKCLQDGFATSARIVGNTEADRHASQLLKDRDNAQEPPTPSSLGASCKTGVGQNIASIRQMEPCQRCPQGRVQTITNQLLRPAPDSRASMRKNDVWRRCFAV